MNHRTDLMPVPSFFDIHSYRKSMGRDGAAVRGVRPLRGIEQDWEWDSETAIRAREHQG